MYLLSHAVCSDNFIKTATDDNYMILVQAKTKLKTFKTWTNIETIAIDLIFLRKQGKKIFLSAIWLPTVQPHSPDVNHCHLFKFRPEGHWEPRKEVGSLGLVEHLAGFKPDIFRFLLQHLNPSGHSPLRFKKIIHVGSYFMLKVHKILTKVFKVTFKLLQLRLLARSTR